MGSKKDKAILAALFDLAEASKGARLGRYGCQTIPKDAQVEVLKRFPSSFQFVRLVKVNVTFTPQPNSRIGYTFVPGFHTRTGPDDPCDIPTHWAAHAADCVFTQS